MNKDEEENYFIIGPTSTGRIHVFLENIGGKIVEIKEAELMLSLLEKAIKQAKEFK